MNQHLIVRKLGLQDYQTTWNSMVAFSQNRDQNTQDEIWLLQHPPVYTQGLAGKPEHILNSGSIPIVQTDRGGQVTYHGPGQLVAYVLIDLRRMKINTRQLVMSLENAVIHLLADYDIKAQARRDAPGVYIDEKKICSLGLRIKKGCSYHGLAFNVDMDLEPFSRINPCGYQGLKMTQLKDYISPIAISQREPLISVQWAEIEDKIIYYLSRGFDYSTAVPADLK